MRRLSWKVLRLLVQSKLETVLPPALRLSYLAASEILTIGWTRHMQALMHLTMTVGQQATTSRLKQLFLVTQTTPVSQ